MLSDDLEEWERVGGGRGVQEGGDICIPVADSCWCVAKTITILLSNYPLILKTLLNPGERLWEPLTVAQLDRRMGNLGT